MHRPRPPVEALFERICRENGIGRTGSVSGAPRPPYCFRVELTDDSQLQRVPAVLGSEVADQYVLLSDDLRYLGLDAVGRRIWDLLEPPRTLGELIARLTDEYDVSSEQCRNDLVHFVQSLTAHGLVTVT